ncbi:hypothetical protein Nisw_06675 [Candidatus Nitrosopumilus sp. SW]|uniref:hypothetical protein n=1 Tax=Candidatus Nitrosopumilus sp. SW TaxID=2508726 RepID=UPI00114E7D2E|nr:hypothetical protein [Candidatus Nitrosopumilus sp. SW]QDI89229.1 hypothetical protein Nisw_06675 [Candidatus Nitrosopumilus sp. SW]
MEQKSTWSDLKSEYYHNLRMLDASIQAANNATLEMNRIYLDVIKKSRNSTPEIMKKFSDTWIDSIPKTSLENMPSLKNNYEKIKSNPTLENFETFGAELQKNIKQKSISEMASYCQIMTSFYDSWKDMWPN